MLAAGLALALALELALELALPSAGAAPSLGLVLLLPWEQSQVARPLACPAHRLGLEQYHETLKTGRNSVATIDFYK